MNKEQKQKVLLAVILLLIMAFVGYNNFLKPEPPKPPINNWTQLVERIKQKKIDQIELNVNNLQAKVVEKKDSKGNKPADYDIVVPGQAANETLVKLSQPPHNLFKYTGTFAKEEPWWQRLLMNILPTLILFALLLYLVRDALPTGKNKHMIEKQTSDVKFEDVAGIGEAVQELQDVKEFLHDPTRFEKLGASIPKGVLLYGPPGSGKTMLAKAVAAEADVPFYSVSGSDFVEMYAGLGARRVRELFQEAKANAPSIVFIDELDAIGKARSGGGGDGGTREADQTLNQFLVEMDGFAVNEKPIVVMAASNLVKTLDPALIRPGRFDRHVAVSAPDKSGRLEILQVHAKGKPLSPDINLESVAVQTSGMTGAELAMLLNEAALQAAKDPKNEMILRKHLDEAMYRVVAGPAKHNRLMSEKERRMTSYHEMGHALIGEELPGNDQVHKVSIVPRGESLGQTFYVSEEDIYSRTSNQLKNRICGMLGGRAAEELFVGEYGTGAANDLQQATDLAYRMITEFGFSQTLGFRVITDNTPLSPARRELVDQEIQSLLDAEYQRAKEILERKREVLKRCAETLLKKETLDREEFLAIAKSQKAFDELEAERNH